MIFRNRRGQTLMESLVALWLLLILFFFIYYIFLIAIDKIRSLDTVYHLARIQEVQETEAAFLTKAPLAILQCFGRPGIIQNTAMGGDTPTNRIGFRYVQNFSSALLRPRLSVMRVAQPNTHFLAYSYPGAPEDDGGMALTPQVAKEEATLVALAHGILDSAIDAVEDVQASQEADKP